MKYTNKFFDDIPIEKRDVVLNKIQSFDDQLLSVKSFRSLPKGFWVRHIEGTDIYKFRVNNGDRVLFKYDKQEKDIIYIAYSNHDSQVRKAKSLSKIQGISYDHNDIDSTFDINTTTYDEDYQDKLINIYMKNLYQETYKRIKEESILDEEYIPLCIESKDLKDKQFLTNQQFECLYGLKKPTIVMGCAGSGKTQIGLVKLKIDYNIGVHSIYITSSPRMKKAASKLCMWMDEKNKKDYFYTLEDLCWKVLGVSSSPLFGYFEFKEWLKQGKWNILKSLNALEVWNEINSIIKGHCLIEGKIMSKDSYLQNNNSNYSKEEKGQLYVLAKAYQKYLNDNGYMDENDLIKEAIKKVDKPFVEGMVIDEVQEINACAIKFLSKIIVKKDNVLLLGDKFQRLSLKYDNYDLLKKEIANNLSLKSLSKNYRNKLGVIKWNNQLKLLQHNVEFEEASEPGEIPYYVVNKNIDNILELANEDISSIVIVENEEQRETIKQMGYKVGRVFTVEESRGLEYDRVYCYNLLNNEKGTINFNAIYVASSRAKEKLFFIEEEDTTFIDKFNGYYQLIEFKKLLSTFEKEENKEMWLKEAKKLEAEEKYEQAIAAYEQAGDTKRAMLCAKAKEKQIAEIMLYDRGQIIDIYADYLDENQIGKVLEKVYDKENKLATGWIEVVRYYKTDGLPTIRNVFLEKSEDLTYIAKVIFNSLRDSFSRNHISLKWVTDKRLEDYKIDILNGEIRVVKKECTHWRIEEKIRKKVEIEFVKKWGYPSYTHIQELENEETISGKSTESILASIFS